MDKHTSECSFDFTPIGLAIKDSREAADIVREKAAEMLDVSARHLQAIELEGQYPSFELFVQLVTRFDISVDQFLFPKRKIVKTSVRRRVDALLDDLSDKELRIIEGTAKAIRKEMD